MGLSDVHPISSFHSRLRCPASSAGSALRMDSLESLGTTAVVLVLIQSCEVHVDVMGSGSRGQR